MCINPCLHRPDRCNGRDRSHGPSWPDGCNRRDRSHRPDRSGRYNGRDRGHRPSRSGRPHGCCRRHWRDGAHRPDGPGRTNGKPTQSGIRIILHLWRCADPRKHDSPVCVGQRHDRKYHADRQHTDYASIGGLSGFLQCVCGVQKRQLYAGYTEL